MAQRPTQKATEAIIQAALDAAQRKAEPLTDPPPSPPTGGRTLRVNIQDTHRIVRRNLQSPFVWLKSPGTLMFSTSGGWSLEDNAQARNVRLDSQTPMKIRVSHYKGEKVLYIWVTKGTDVDGVIVKPEREYLVANIARFMFEEGIVPKPGLKQKFDLIPAPEPMGDLPALCIHLDKARKTTHFRTDYPKKRRGGRKGKQPEGT